MSEFDAAAQVELMRKMRSYMSDAEKGLTGIIALLSKTKVHGPMAEAFATKFERMEILARKGIELATRNINVDWDSEFEDIGDA